MIPVMLRKTANDQFCPDCGGPITQEPILSLLQCLKTSG